MNFSHDLLMEEMGWWLTNKKVSLWEYAFQAEEKNSCGWALYCTNQIDGEALMSEISKRVGGKSHPDGG